jgi:hypothetical protein
MTRGLPLASGVLSVRFLVLLGPVEEGLILGFQALWVTSEPGHVVGPTFGEEVAWAHVMGPGAKRWAPGNGPGVA